MRVKSFEAWAIRALSFLIVLLHNLIPSSALSAEIGCNLRYADAHRTTEEIARKLWPSGARPNKDSCLIGAIRGEMTNGDYNRMVAFYRKHHPFMRRVLLNSPGGNVGEAIRIGKLLRKYLITAEAPLRIGAADILLGYSPEGPWNQFDTGTKPSSRPYCKGAGCVCASACALIWFGAPHRQGTVGLHRPRFSDPSFGRLPADDAAAAYNHVLREIANYLRLMEAPSSIVERMVSTASVDILWLDDDRFGSIRLDRAPSFSEWIDASCGGLSTQDDRVLIELRVKERDQGLNSVERQILDMLADKETATVRCEYEVVSSNRDSLAPP